MTHFLEAAVIENSLSTSKRASERTLLHHRVESLICHVAYAVSYIFYRESLKTNIQFIYSLISTAA